MNQSPSDIFKMKPNNSWMNIRRVNYFTSVPERDPWLLFEDAGLEAAA